MGITARGAWECVREHFRSLGLDVQSDPFTVAGIGDMAGDVFGNGMLRSRAMRVVAAFNHAHIFIDPDPDPARTFAERERLFHLPRSTWRDYDTRLISRGGGVFDRSAKAIPLSAEVRRLLDIDTDAGSGEEIIRADNFLAKFLQPIERIFGITLLGASTVHAVEGRNLSNTGGL